MATKLKIFVYNSGIDRVPVFKSNSRFSANTSFHSYTQKKIPNFKPSNEDIKSGVMDADNTFSCNPNNRLITDYNARIASKMKQLINKNGIDIAILQEYCNINDLEINNSRFSGKYDKYYPYNNDVFDNLKRFYVGVFNPDISFPQCDYNNLSKIAINNYVQVLCLEYQNKYFHIINLHRRQTKYGVQIEILLYILGNVLKIYETYGNMSNIIICGDYNNSKLFDKLDNNRSEQDIINNFINNLDNIYDKNNSQRNIKLLQDVIGVLFNKIGFKSCEDLLQQNFDYVVNNCGKKYGPTKVNDIFYYLLDRDCTIEQDDELKQIICQYYLSTSSHLPFLVDINIEHNSTNVKENSEIPEYIYGLVNINDDIISRGSDYDIKNINKKDGGCSSSIDYESAPSRQAYKYKKIYINLKKNKII